MAYERKEISIESIRRQEDICREIYERFVSGKAHPLAMVDTYGCQQNEADSEKLRGYLAEMGYAFTMIHSLFGMLKKSKAGAPMCVFSTTR